MLSAPQSAIQIPKSLSDLLSPEAKAQLEQAEALLNSLRNLQVFILLPNGQQLNGVIQISGTNAVVYIRANAGGAPSLG